MNQLNRNSLLALVFAVTLTACESKHPGNKIDVAPLGNHAEVYVRAMSTAPQYQEKIGLVQSIEVVASEDMASRNLLLGSDHLTEGKTFLLKGTKGNMQVALRMTSKSGKPWNVDSADVTFPE